VRERSILGGSSHQSPALSRAHRFQWRTERIGGSGLHFDHDQLRTAPAHKVELAAPGGEAGAHNFVATLFEEVGRGPLPGPAEL
jgi:hypothetical protein